MVQKQIYIDIVENLKPHNPFKIVLFGSYAYGNPDQDSDLDILVVLNNNNMPTTFTEKQSLYLSVSKSIRTIKKQVPIDLIVYTKPMYELFLAQHSSFSKEIQNKGIVLYENSNETVA